MRSSERKPTICAVFVSQVGGHNCRSSGFREPTSLPTFTGFLWRNCSSCGQIVFHLVIIGFQSFCSSHCRWLASRIILWQDSAKLWEPNVVVLHSLKFEASNALRCQGHLLKKKTLYRR